MRGLKTESGAAAIRTSAPRTNSPATHASIESWLRLRAIERLGDRTIIRLIQTWGTPEAVLRATRAELVAHGCGASLADAIVRGPDDDALRRIDREMSVLGRTSVEVRSVLDHTYPARLRQIPDPPPLLYVSGTLVEADGLAVAIVGTRKASTAGRVVTEELARDLADAGFTVVSGLARGVDAAAHRGAISCGGRTIAVLGCGVDLTYPREHERLRRAVEEQGAVVSEFPLGTPPHNGHFPRRNRIISGLSLGVIVAEAAVNSGSLITARLAADQGREVFAVPGFVKSETNRGSNALLKEGATLVECAEDVIVSLESQLDSSLSRLLRRTTQKAKNEDVADEREEAVRAALTHEPQTVDDLVDVTKLSAATVMAALLSLEIKNRARQLSGRGYFRA